MPRSAQLQIPPVLAALAPTQAAYTTSLVHAIALDGELCPPDVQELAAPLGPSSLNFMQEQLRELARVADRVGVGEDAVLEVATAMRQVDAATLQLGTLARMELRSKLKAMVEWLLEHHDSGKGTIARFAYAMLFRVRREFLRRYGARGLWLELRDERQREAARWTRVHARRTCSGGTADRAAPAQALLAGPSLHRRGCRG
jgi:hypothetical protein